MTETPLAEADPRSLDELFSRDPLELSNQDISVIVAKFRAQREVWLATPEGGTKKAKAEPRAKASAPPKVKVTLEMLKLKINPGERS